jgi:hypothetical protein
MGLGLSTRDQVWLLVSVSPHQNDDAILETRQTNESLLTIRFAVIFPGEHGFIEDAVALRQIDAMLSQVELSLGGVIAQVLFIVYALNGRRNGIAEATVLLRQVVAAFQGSLEG